MKNLVHPLAGRNEACDFRLLKFASALLMIDKKFEYTTLSPTEIREQFALFLYQKQT